MAQDSIGRIWIGTSEGISVYDGQSFENISSTDGLRNEIINCFFEVRTGKMLIGTNGAGVALSIHPFGRPDTLVYSLSGKSFFCQDSVNQIIHDSHGNIWLSTDGGITKWGIDGHDSISIHNYDKKNWLGGRLVTQIVTGPDSTIWVGTTDGFFRLVNRHFMQIKPKNGPSRIIVTSLCFDQRGTLWIGTQNQGIMSYRDQHIKHYPWGLSKSLGRINCIIMDRNGTLWFGTNRGLVHFDHHRAKLIDQRLGLTDDLVICLMQDREGNIWIGTQSGLNLYLDDGFTAMSSSGNSVYITQILREPNGHELAVGSQAIYRVKDYQLKILPFTKKINAAHIHRVLYQNDDSLLVATNNGLFLYNKIDEKLQKIKGFDKEGYRSVFAMAYDQDGGIWIGSDGGLSFLTQNNVLNIPSSSRMKHSPAIVKKLSQYPLPRSSLRTLLVDHKNRLWLGYWSSGLYMFDGNHLKSFSAPDGFNSHQVRFLFEDHKGDIWIATRDRGVYRYDGRLFRNYSRKNVLESNWVMSITQDNKNRMWFGTANGLMMYDGSKWHAYHSHKELPIEYVTAVCPAVTDTIFVGTSGSLFEYNLKKGKAPPIRSTIYLKNITGHNHYVTSLSVSPGILDLKELGKFLSTSITHDEIVTLPYPHNVLNIKINGIHYQNNSAILYSYKLLGLDSTWSRPGIQSSVSYRNLPPGTYRFLARAIVNDRKSPKTASFSFTILTPYWQRFWFLAMIIALAISLIVAITSAINRYRYKQILRIAQIRSDIASDLHDDIGSALSSISIYSELARREAKNNPEHAARFSGRVENISRNLMDAINDIIWSINPGNETLEDVVLRMEEFAVDLLEAKGIEVFLEIPDHFIDISLDLHSRRNLLLIFKEIINNAARHSGATKVEIGIEVKRANKSQKKMPQFFCITISDNGIGFDPMLEGNGNGLHNIKKRAEDIGGKLIVSSGIEKGTRIELCMLLKK